MAKDPAPTKTPKPTLPTVEWKTLFFHPDEMARALTLCETDGWEVKHIVSCGHTFEHAAYLRRSL